MNLKHNFISKKTDLYNFSYSVFYVWSKGIAHFIRKLVTRSYLSNYLDCLSIQQTHLPFFFYNFKASRIKKKVINSLFLNLQKGMSNAWWKKFASGKANQSNPCESQLKDHKNCVSKNRVSLFSLVFFIEYMKWLFLGCNGKREMKVSAQIVLKWLSFAWERQCAQRSLRV